MFTRSLVRALAVVASAIPAVTAFAYQDPLIRPADASVLAPRAMLTAMAHAGDRMVAVGQRGIVIWADSKDPSRQWRQASVPVSADLTGVTFAPSGDGWAVGHGAVVLHSADYGETWVKQTDGEALAEAALAHYKSSIESITPERRVAVLAQAGLLAEEKEAQPLLDVWFKDARSGYVVGTFNRIFRTDDGGASWIPLIDRTDNPEELHFYAVRGMGDEVYLAGERGMVWRWDKGTSRFVAVRTPYSGSLFGLIVTPQAVLVYGMRGSVYRTTDRGGRWQHIGTGLRAGIVAGDVRPNGDIVLVAQSGDAVVSPDGGETFVPLPLEHRESAAAMLAGPDGNLVLVGPNGVRDERVGRGNASSSSR